MDQNLPRCGMMASQKSDIKTITLDLKTADGTPHRLAREHHRVLKDLAANSCFKILNDTDSPYCINLSMVSGKLIFQMKNAAQQDLPSLILSLSPYKRIIKDYFMMIDSHDALRGQAATASKLETIDMARRSLHNEGAALMIERMSDKITLDKETARGLFTLLCVLHISHHRKGWA